MFVRRIVVTRIDANGFESPCPIHCIDNFAMRNFTNDAVFDDMLPVADRLMEAGHRVPLDRLGPAMEDWFRRKGYLKVGEKLRVFERKTTEDLSNMNLKEYCLRCIIGGYSVGD
jgi:hypothetical protein